MFKMNGRSTVNGIFLVMKRYATYPYDPAMMIYKNVHTGPKSHEGGAHVGLIRV
jgi:hypothetical protein